MRGLCRTVILAAFLVVAGCGSGGGSGASDAGGDLADVPAAVSADTTSEPGGLADTGGEADPDVADSAAMPDVPDAAAVCGANVPAADCERCGPSPDPVVCPEEECPFYDPPSRCFFVCGATYCYDCVNAYDQGWKWQRVEYDCVMGDHNGGGEDTGTEPDASEPAPDAAVAEVSADAPACAYLDLQVFLIDCGPGHGYVHDWTDTDGDPTGCPEYFTLDGGTFATLTDAAQAAGCSTDCLRTMSTAVMFLMCGHKDEYIVWKSDRPECPDRLEFSTGFYDSLEAYQAANPCA